jgi:SagB-type dehydrogenase family enzyme
VPSGGARYPLELYIAVSHVTEVAEGIHHFNARDRMLRPVLVPYCVADLVSEFMHQHYLEGAAALIIMTAVFPRMLDKYGARGYRYTLIECGHAAQNICLRSVELGLASLCLGGFTDHRLNAILQLERTSEGALYAVAVGKAAGVPTASHPE